MSKNQFAELAVFAGLVVAGSAVSLSFQDIPNFAPIAALSLFAGYYFRSFVLAICVPLTVLAVKDSVIGTYDWRLMTLVYGTLLAPVALRGILRSRFVIDGARPSLTAYAFGGLVGCSLLSSVAFFVITNFGCWAMTSHYESTWTGLVECYVAAIPFFRNTLAGDLFFSTATFGGLAAVRLMFANVATRKVESIHS